jgi:hypothetical protein
MLRNPEIFALLSLFALSTTFGAVFFLVKTISIQKLGRK